MIAPVLLPLLLGLPAGRPATPGPRTSGAHGGIAAALPFVSPMFGDRMVLQRGKPNTFWGWAKPGERVQVEIADESAATVTGPDGRWQVKIRPPAPGGPYDVRVEGPEKVEFHEVLVGDVWLCGGQSNMYLGLGRARNGAEEIKAADHPEIRMFMVEQKVSYSPAATPGGVWKTCTPQTVAEGGASGFSAVAYFFARKLQSRIHVPIGLIEDCVGGTPAETWTSPEALRPLKDFDVPLAEVERLRSKGGPPYGNYIMHWYDEYDVGSRESTWADPNLDDSSWAKVQVPGGFRELGVGDTPSVVWFRRTFTLPEVLPPGQATLFLGSIEKMDTTTINGRWVGASSWVENPRVYGVAPGVLRPGRNQLTVRVFKVRRDGGFLAKPDDLRLVLGDGTVVPLAGDWNGRVSVDARPPHPMPLGFENYPTMPSVLFEGMLAPVAPLAIRGFLWYQGEANSARAHQYQSLLPAMIADWRKLFGQGDLPFYIVSLPAFMHRRQEPGDDAWAELREAQALTAQHVKNSGLAVTVDVGDPDDIHPKDKKEVGERLALCALAQEYGQRVVFSGPTLRSAELAGDSIKLHFDHAEGGLLARGGKLEGFAVAGDDRKWFWADAQIVGASIVVSSPRVLRPKVVRYAWQANPAANLYNGSGLPAVPFRTDSWRGITEGGRRW